MIIFAWIIGISAAIFMLLASLAFLKAKDVFVMIQIVMMTNFYVIPLLLLGVEFEKFSTISLAKTSAIIILNLVMTTALCHVIARRAVINKITPDADFKQVD